MEFKKDINNECGFHIDKKKSFCSPDFIVDKLKTILDKNKKNDKSVMKFDEKNILESLKEKYNCDTEVCILNQPDIKQTIGNDVIQYIIQENFKPTGPRGTQWLSNVDIDSVLFQIQQKYTDKHFLHIPFQMIDFEIKETELYQLDWPHKYNEGFRTFGTVINTDNSSGPGQHWFAIFADFLDESSDFSIEYFNSSGELPMKQITAWINRVKILWQSNFKKNIKDVIVTRMVNQYDENNCGSYSLYYIISRLHGIPYKYFEHTKIGDNNMKEFRKYLFRKE